MSETMRMLNRDLDMSKYMEIEGGLLVKDVPLLAAGIWTDSAIGTALHYGPDTLKKFAENWKADGFWARHAGGAPRSIMDLIGNVVLPRYDPSFREAGMTESGAVVADIFYSYSTQNGRDAAAQAIARAKQGKPLAVSVEHGGAEAFDPRTNRLEAQTIDFFGLASVEKGACKVCNLPKRTDEESIQENVKHMDEPKQDFAKMLSDAKTEMLAAVDAKFAALKIPSDASEDLKKMSATNDSLVKELELAKTRIEALEKTPHPKTVPAEEGKVKELEDAPVRKLPKIMGGDIVCE